MNSISYRIKPKMPPSKVGFFCALITLKVVKFLKYLNDCP